MPDLSPDPRATQSAADAPDVTQSVANLEPLGGDLPCWAHLFEDDDEAPIHQRDREG